MRHLYIIIYMLAIMAPSAVAQVLTFPYEPDVQASRGRNHSEEERTDRSVGRRDIAYMAGKVLVGPIDVGVDRDVLGDRWWDGIAKTMHHPFVMKGMGAGSDSILVSEPIDTVIDGSHVHYEIFHDYPDYKRDEHVRWMTLEEIRKTYYPHVTGQVLYSVNKFFITGQQSAFRIDSSFIYRLEKLESGQIEALRGLPPFTVIRIFTKTVDNYLAMSGETRPQPAPQQEKRREEGEFEEHSSEGRLLYHSSLYSVKIRNHQSLNFPDYKTLYEGEARTAFRTLCKGMEERVQAYLGEEGMSRLFVWNMKVDSQGEVLEVTYTTTCPMMEILSMERFAQLDSMLKSIRFPAFNNRRCPYSTSNTYINIGFGPTRQYNRGDTKRHL